MQLSPATESSFSSDPFQSSHSRWLALTHRIPSSHSSFLYGVKSTKIYCRPTCSARLARRANVVFYDTEDQARHDGFRPCKRCKPDDATFVGEGEEIVTRAVALMRAKKDESTMKRGLEELAKDVGVTRSYLCRVFKKRLGVTVGTYMKEFEEGASNAETDSSPQSSSKVGAAVVDAATGLQTPATTPSCLATPVEGLENEPAEEVFENIEELVDVDVDFDEWFWNEAFSNYG